MFQGDLVVKTAIELCLEDMRQQPWIIEDCFKSLVENPYLKDKYGWKEIQRAKDFIRNNHIPVYLKERVDKQEFPCITISIGDGNEAEELATLGDQSVCVEELEPGDIGRPIPYIIKPFKPVSFDSQTGIVEVPTDIEEWKYIDNGMIAIDPETGEGYVISGKAGTHGFKVAAGAEFDGEIAVVPQYGNWRARREKIESKYNYNIGCHVHGDPSALIFLFDIVKYGLLRYRESLLEANDFQLSTLRFTDLIKNNAFGEENVYSRWVILKGQVEESWLKGPKRIIEAIDVFDSDTGFTGITVAAGEAPDFIDEESEPWISVEDEEDGE